ncbi:AraC family transcriptional regulator [Pseudomonas sp. RIT-PI-S]|uniref:AraC family transcriptional regulator n=1 Tax=Pseudomonas sp. RIT-PI-S TaxID=3035295 RepID=UPI0021D9856E|nr:AraC family transcriptional regulator [Pseudomonas sp. RIT-PI-S]
MTPFDAVPEPLNAPIELQRAELAGIIGRHTESQLLCPSAVPGLVLVRYNHCARSFPALAQPALCVLAHGSKEVSLGEERYVYDSLNYMVVSVAMPMSGRILDASVENPSLSLRLDIDPAEITALIADAGPLSVPARPAGRGLYVDRLSADLLDAILRLTRLSDTPRDVAVLAPLIRREVLYRLLRSPQGHRLYEIAQANSQAHRVTQAIHWLNDNYGEPLRIEDLARRVNLSASTLHHRFKALTSMSPLQYQKQLRLQEARRLMLADGLDVSVASYRVGYESPSQFSREYSRLFGAPPSRDMARLRLAPMGSAAL